MERATKIRDRMINNLGIDFKRKATYSAYNTLVQSYMRKPLKKSEKLVQVENPRKNTN